MKEAVNREESGKQYNKEYFQNHCGPIPYDRSRSHGLKFFGEVADEIIRRLNPNRVLDVGCAKGDRGVEASGFDISEYAISQVRPI